MLSLLVLFFGTPHALADDDRIRELEAKVAALEHENTWLQRRLLWYSLFDAARLPYEATVTHTYPLGGGAPTRKGTAKYRPAHLPENPTKDEVRTYVATILARADPSAASGDAPEIELLRKVGPGNVDVLIDAVVFAPMVAPKMYVVEVLKTLVTHEHQRLVLDWLPHATDLVEVLVEKGWTQSAAPTLLRVLTDRDPYLSVDWIVAAAQVARHEHRDDLKFYLVRNPNSVEVWKAIRDLPGIEPLDDLVASTWQERRLGRDDWERRQFGIVAAYYGHLDAFGELVQRLDNHTQEIEAFEELTGHRLDPWRSRGEQARTWLTENKDRLVFDRAQRRYVAK